MIKFVKDFFDELSLYGEDEIKDSIKYVSGFIISVAVGLYLMFRWLGPLLGW